MSEYTTDNAYIKNRANTVENKELAGDYLAEQGYEHHATPREVNGGRDRLPKNHARTNVAKLNRSLVTTPSQVKSGAQVKRPAKRVSNDDSVLVEIKKEKSKTPLPISFFMCVAAITVMLIYVVHLCVELDDLKTGISDLNDGIASMKLEERMLQSEKATKYNLEEITRIAVQEYGMVDADQLPKEYITPDAEDSIEIMEKSPESETPGALLSGFAGVVSELLSYIN